MSRHPAVDALVGEAVAVANSILQGHTSAYRGAKRLWAISSTLALLHEEWTSSLAWPPNGRTYPTRAKRMSAKSSRQRIDSVRAGVGRWLSQTSKREGSYQTSSFPEAIKKRHPAGRARYGIASGYLSGRCEICIGSKKSLLCSNSPTHRYQPLVSPSGG